MPNFSLLDQPLALSHIFFPQKTRRTRPAANAEDVDIRVDDAAMLGCRFHAAAPQQPTILYFHGNGETVGDYDDIAGEYCRAGLNILVATYRGYGWSTGAPTVTAMLADALTVSSFSVEWLNGRGFSGPRLIMGRSLGSVSAIEIGMEHSQEYKGMVIESGFADTLPLAETLGFAVEGLTEEDGFGNAAKIARIKLPTLILHGARDQLIPPFQAEKLQMESGARNKQFQLIPGADHNSLIAVAGERYFQCIRKFADEISGANTWRHRRRKFKEENAS